jgi:hypothetical protein
MTALTIFTAPKAFKDAHISIIQRNAIQSWQTLGPDVQIILMGNDEGIAETAAELRVSHRPDVGCNALGTPLISSMFNLARQANDSPLLLCINADIILIPGFVELAQMIAYKAGLFLAIGQRWDLDLREPLSFDAGWVDRLSLDVQQRGRLHPAVGSDYFVFPRPCYINIPDFVIGRSAWDNWMIYDARRKNLPVIDLTSSALVVHQDHDYGHLPGGKPPYHLPETLNNIRLAGGRRAIFYISDANLMLKDGRLRPIPRSWKKFWRDVETYPMARLHSQWLAELLYFILHPRLAWLEWRGRITYKLQQVLKKQDGEASRDAA